MTEFGYAGKILHIDLCSRYTADIPTADYASRFLGGRGIAAKLYWDQVPPGVRALDPDNPLIMMTGPLAGFTRLSGSRWQVCGKSPATDPESFSYGNAGGSWGAGLKFAGYDGLVFRGRADSPAFVILHDGRVDFRDASPIWGKTTTETRETLKAQLGKATRIVATGPAGENAVPFATLLADDDTSISSGFGSVMASKNLKAVAVAGDRRPRAADPAGLRDLADCIGRLRRGALATGPLMAPHGIRRHACFGCIAGCRRAIYQAANGDRGKFFCQSAATYREASLDRHGEWNEVVFHANRLCDKYGLSTGIVQPMISWLARCHEEGILSDEETGLPLSTMGTYEFIESLVRKIALREGFGDILALGTFKAAESVGRGSDRLIGDSIATRANELMSYDPRLYIITGLLYATEPRKPIQQIHEVSMTVIRWIQWLKGEEGGFLSDAALRQVAARFWGSEVAGDFSNYDGAALAAKKIQDRTYAKESLVLCDWSWPILWSANSPDHVGDASLESRILSAVTGIQRDQEELDRIGERIFNLQRAIFTREGRQGRESDSLLEAFHTIPLEHENLNRRCIVPGRNGEVISRKGALLPKDDFEAMKSEYYALRGWDVSTALQTQERLDQLELGDIAAELQSLGLLR